ncbi:MAG: cadmium-translocating P-type ATPase, partial [Chloroflexi bacterium]|nr:cadmium-translocating P-type ATPase [Chloroflexota bacterium]
MTTTNKQTFFIEGMDCVSCARTLEKGVAQLDGVNHCQINFTTEKLTIDGEVAPEALVSQVRQLGYDVREETDDGNTAVSPPPNFWHFLWQQTETRLALFGALFVLPGLFIVEIGGQESAVVSALSVIALALAGWPIARSGWAAIRINREININVLMTVAAVGAVFIGAYTEAAMVMVLFALGEALEGYTAGRARYAVRSLMTVVPNKAVKLLNGRQTTVPVSQLQIGDRILVKPGARISMDGRVLSGVSTVNQAPITGESQPVDKQTGDTVFAGTINGTAALEIEVTHLAADNTVSRLVQMVQEAQEKQAPAQRFVDQFARYYTPAVMVLAVLVATIPPLFFNQPFLNDGETLGWLYRSLALLVVACPCALVISTPVTIVSAISNGAKHGILFKGGTAVEAFSRVQAIAFDKTGTLTKGQPAVVALRSAACTGDECVECQDMLALANAVEQQSEHPLAQAIVQETAVRGLSHKYPLAQDVKALTGQGVMGQVSGRSVIIGSHTYFDEQIPHDVAVCQEATADTIQGYTPMMVGADGVYMGTISVADTVRPSSQTAIQQLQQAGIQHTVMLTGDNRATAQSIAAELKLTDIRAELLPEDKMTAVTELQKEYGRVAMVGDGINDAPALALADVGIAI